MLSDSCGCLPINWVNRKCCVTCFHQIIHKEFLDKESLWISRNKVFFTQRHSQEVSQYWPLLSWVQVSSVAQPCPTLCDPMNCSTPGLPVHHQLPKFTQTQYIESVMPSSHLILCRPLLLLPSIPPSIRVFSSESALHMRWPKYWSFSFSISPSKEHPGLISFRMDWLTILCSLQQTIAEGQSILRTLNYVVWRL